jgi:cation transporter-like permease
MISIMKLKLQDMTDERLSADIALSVKRITVGTFLNMMKNEITEVPFPAHLGTHSTLMDVTSK